MPDGFIDIVLDVNGDVEVARSFQIAETLAEDLSDPLGELMDQLLDSVAAQFDTEGAAAEGVPWQPLSDQYARWKAARYPGFPILVRDGAMKTAMLNKEEAVHVTTDMAVYEPVSDIAGYHQSGADWIGPAWGSGEYPHHLPQRKMVDLTEEWKHAAVDRTFARWLAGMLKESGLAVSG